MYLSLAIHLFYFSFLILAYRLGDFSQVYPIARGVAPSACGFRCNVICGREPVEGGWAGLLTISFAISLLVLLRGKGAE